MYGDHPADYDSFWWEQRVDDMLFAIRVNNGQCGNCGAYDGPDHRCPPVVSGDA